MGMEFGWWKTDDEGKYHLKVMVHGGNVAWRRKFGRRSDWMPYGEPNDEDWERLISEAERRVPRRLISPKQFDALKALLPK